MANELLHIKDAYYFEVPKALWRPHYETLSEVPYFLRELHKEDFHLVGDDLTEAATAAAEAHALHEFNTQMAGKILIPQPPGVRLNSLYSAETPFALSKFMILELLVAVGMILLFRWVARHVRADAPPRNRIANMFEGVLDYIRKDIAERNIGHGAGKFVPLLWAIFFFVLFCNLLGLVPWLGTPTAAIGCTIALAAAILVTTLYTGFSTFGPKWVWKGFVPHMDLPAWLFPLKAVIAVVMLAIEWFGLMIKHAILAVRLLANMAAGHLVLLGIMGIIVAAAQNPDANYGIAAAAGIFGATAISVLEVGVAFIQAYVFTLLSALFIGTAAHEH